MAMQVLTATLKGALIDCGRIIDKTMAIPVMRCVRLDATRTHLKLSATDLETSRIQMIKAEERGDAEWSAAVPWKALKAAMPKKVKDAPVVKLSLTVDGMLLVEPVTQHGVAEGFAAIPAHPVEEWPILPSLGEYEPTAVIAGESFHGMLSKVVSAISKEDNRFQLAGAHLELNGKARAVATDGHRLHCADAELEVNLTGDPCGKRTSEDLFGLMPGRGIRSILMDRGFKWSGRGKAAGFPRVQIQQSEHHYQVESSRGVRYTMRILEGTFPDYERVISKGESCRISVVGQNLINALDALDPVFEKGRQAFRLTIAPGTGDVVLSAKSPERGREEAKLFGAHLWGGMQGKPAKPARTDRAGHMIAAEPATAPSNEIGLNSRFLKDIVSGMSTERVNLHMTDENSQVRITLDSDPTFRSVVMPLRL